MEIQKEKNMGNAVETGILYGLYRDNGKQHGNYHRPSPILIGTRG